MVFPKKIQGLGFMSHGLGMSFTSFLQASVGDIPEILGDYIQNWTFTKPCSIVPWSVVLIILKNMEVNGKDDIPYIMENKSHVPNHQPVPNRGIPWWPHSLDDRCPRIREHQSSSWKEVHPDMRIRKTKTMGPHSSKLTLLSIPEVGIVTIVP